MSTRFVNNSRFVVNDMVKSLSFNGSSDYATAPFTISSTGFNFAGWFYFFRKGTQEIYLGDVASMSNTGGFGFVNDGVNIYIKLRNNTTSVFCGNLPLLPIATWTHITFTHDGSTALTYINSVLSATKTSAQFTNTNQSVVSIGSSTTPSLYAKVLIDNLIIHNTTTPWTQSQINDIYYKDNPPNGITARYNFNNNVIDQSGNGKTLTLNGTQYSSEVFIKSRSASSNRTRTTRQSI